MHTHTCAQLGVADPIIKNKGSGLLCIYSTLVMEECNSKRITAQLYATKNFDISLKAKKYSDWLYNIFGTKRWPSDNKANCDRLSKNQPSSHLRFYLVNDL